MEVTSPKLRLLYYKNVLDLAVARFFGEFNNDFSKTSASRYVFSSDASRESLKKTFKRIIIEVIEELDEPWSIESPSWLVLLGGCYPKNNIILKHRDSKDYFPAKLEKTLEMKPAVKWILAEKDIDIDLELFNEIFNEVFSELATKKIQLKPALKNVVCISHKSLDCYMLFKILKWIYGRSACSNVYEASGISKSNLPLIAINDLLSKYIHNKQAMNKSREFKKCALEVKQQLAELLNPSKLVES